MGMSRVGAIDARLNYSTEKSKKRNGEREKEERPLKKQRGKNESHRKRSYDTESAA